MTTRKQQMPGTQTSTWGVVRKMMLGRMMMMMMNQGDGVSNVEDMINCGFVTLRTCMRLNGFAFWNGIFL